METSKRAHTGKSKGKISTAVKVDEAVVSKQQTDSEASDASSDEEGNKSGATSEAESDYEELSRAHRAELKAKRTKKFKVADAEDFAQTLTSILGQDVTTTRAPIMAKNRKREEEIREEIISYKASKALVEEKRALLSKDRVIPSFENFEYERSLRKTATKGVIKLFNVVKAQQTELSQINATKTTQTEKFADMSKSRFLDLLKSKTS